MQRLFSTFPGGWPSLGLLLLRVAIGVSAVTDAVGYLAGHPDAGIALWFAGVSAIACAALLVFGFLTPIAGAVLALCVVITPFLRLNALQTLAVTIAIVLLGPGALSIDARLFGRREIRF